MQIWRLHLLPYRKMQCRTIFLVFFGMKEKTKGEKTLEWYKDLGAHLPG
jgi:hypothetical protein